MTCLGKPLDISHGIEKKPITWDNNLTQRPGFFFKYVKTSVPGPGFSKEKFTEQFAGCACKGVCTIKTCICLQLFGCVYDEGGKLNILSNQSSKPVLECGHTCSCDQESCVNRVVQKGIKNTLCIFHTADKGYGLMLDSRSESEISRLNFVCEYAGEVIGAQEAKQRMKQTDTTGQDNYLIALREHISGAEICTYVDPKYVGNVGRFINHSCDPNLVMVPVRINHQVPRLALFARKSIKPGEELTFDYSGKASLVSDYIIVNEPSQACSFDSKTQMSDSNSVIYLPGTLIYNSNQTSDLTKDEDMKPPKKRMKRSTANSLTSINNTDYVCHDLASSGSKNTENNMCHDWASSGSKNTENNVCHDSASLRSKNTENIVCHDSASSGIKNDKVPVKFKELRSDIAHMKSSNFETEHEKPVMESFMSKKPCFCGSQNCSGFLPLDGRLLFD